MDIPHFNDIYKGISGHLPMTLREDFCGTFFLASEWVRQSDDHRALAIDLDPEPLDHGINFHKASLSDEEQKRLQVFQQDARKSLSDKADITYVGNFSIFEFHDRSFVLEYFKTTLEGLNDDGILILDTVGGSGFAGDKYKDHRRYKHEQGSRKGKVWFHYYWEHSYFNPITQNARFAIHFKTKDGMYKDVFTYDWRLWSIPELRDCMIEAGFKDMRVFWHEEGNDDEESAYSYEQVSEADHDETWLAYLVGVK